MEDKKRVEIKYCRQCRWLLRASRMAQELLATFDVELGEVSLVPGTGGVYSSSGSVTSSSGLGRRRAGSPISGS